MPRYKPIDTGLKFLPIDLSVQLLPGTFEHALSYLLDHELDLRVLDWRFKNDESGAPAYSPSVVLKFAPGLAAAWIKQRAPVLCTCCGALMRIVKTRIRSSLCGAMPLPMVAQGIQ